MKKLFLLFSIFAPALLFVSCVSEDKVHMVGVEDFTMISETQFEVTVKIENLNKSSLTIKSASLILADDQTELIELFLTEKVIIPRSSNQGLVFPVAMRMSSPDVFSTLSEKAKADKQLMVRGKVVGKFGIFSKSYKIGPMPVEEFLAKLDESNREMIKGWIY